MSRQHGFVGRAENFDDAMKCIQGSALLDRRMFADLFPDSQIIFEKVYGLPKSLMAIRTAM